MSDELRAVAAARREVMAASKARKGSPRLRAALDAFEAAVRTDALTRLARQAVMDFAYKTYTAYLELAANPGAADQ